jgi:hypothetical protein
MLYWIFPGVELLTQYKCVKTRDSCFRVCLAKDYFGLTNKGFPTTKTMAYCGFGSLNLISEIPFAMRMALELIVQYLVGVDGTNSGDL